MKELINKIKQLSIYKDEYNLMDILEEYELVENKIVDTDRWTITKRDVIYIKDKGFIGIEYRCPATESQMWCNNNFDVYEVIKKKIPSYVKK